MTATSAIISTSTNAQPKAYAEWAQQGQLYVAGDMNTPTELEEYVKDLGGVYLRPIDQEAWDFSDTLGWNNGLRHNVATMQAYADGFQYITSVADNVFPTCDDWIEQHIDHLNNIFPGSTSSIGGTEKWFDLGRLNNPATRQRGTPFGVMPKIMNRSKETIHWPDCVVSTGLVIGDPDTDAVTRLTRSSLQVMSTWANGILDRGQWCAFSSLATMWRRDWAPMMVCLPGLGRYSDIFAAFIVNKVMQKHSVSFYAGEPNVSRDLPNSLLQDKNDLRDEVLGMETTPFLIKRLSTMTWLHDETSLADDWFRAVTRLRPTPAYLPDQAFKFASAWVAAWSRVDQERSLV